MPVDIIRERHEAKAHAQTFTLWPRLWQSFAYRSKVFIWTELLFSSSELSKIPRTAGVYSFIIKPGIANHQSCSYLVYVGRTDNLRRRFKEYLDVQAGRRKHSPKVEVCLVQYMDYLYFVFSKERKSLIKNIEQALLDAYIPPFNDKKTISSKVGNIVRAF